LSSGYYIEEYDRPSVTIWHRINRFLWVLLVLTMIGVVIGAFLPELQKQRSEREERDRLHRLIDEQRSLHSRYERQIGWLEHDPVYLEIIARDKLDMAKPEETILRPDAVKTAPPETQRVEPGKSPRLLK
jgi:cell division protein FtsB